MFWGKSLSKPTPTRPVTEAISMATARVRARLFKIVENALDHKKLLDLIENAH